MEAGRDLSSSQKLCGLAAITSVHVYLPITKISHSKVPDLTAGHGLSTSKSCIKELSDAVSARGPPRRASAYEISKSTGFHVDFGFQNGFLDFQSGFLDLKVDF